MKFFGNCSVIPRFPSPFPKGRGQGVGFGGNARFTVTAWQLPLPFLKGEGSGVGFGGSYNYKNVAKLARCKPHPLPLPFGKGEGSRSSSFSMTLLRLRVRCCASKMQSGSKTRFCSKDHASASEMHAAWSQQARQQVPRRGTLAPIRANEGGGFTAWLSETPPLAPPLWERGGEVEMLARQRETPPLAPPLWERGGEVASLSLCIVHSA